LITTKVKGNTSPLEIRDKIAEKHKVKKRWQMTWVSRTKTELNRLTHELRRAILEIKEQSVETYLQALTDDASTDYALKKATRRLTRQTMYIPEVRKHDSTWARNNKEKAETFADRLEKTLQPHEKRTIDNLRRIEEALNKKCLR
jgi:glutamyl-tRNA reductase